jgi:hypothetical protein
MPLEGMVTGIGDPLLAIHGMAWRTPLLRAFAAGQGQSATARWSPLLPLAVPWFMPQTCSKVLLGYESLEGVPTGRGRRFAPGHREWDRLAGQPR